MGLSKEKQKLIQRLQTTRQRAKEGLFLVEGVRGAGEFLAPDARLGIRFALVSPRLTELQGGEALRDQLQDSGIPVETLEDQELWALSATEQPQGVLLVGEEPTEAWHPEDLPSGPRLLILDGIQDPGNVGTLVRAARAFGLDGVVALDGTCDPWNPKAVRASAGAPAHIQIHRADWETVSSWLQAEGIPLLVAEAGGVDVRRAEMAHTWAMVLGSEGTGVRPEIRTEAAQHLAIPMTPGVDSLNVAMAGSILLFSLSPTPTDRETR